MCAGRVKAAADFRLIRFQMELVELCLHSAILLLGIVRLRLEGNFTFSLIWPRVMLCTVRYIVAPVTLTLNVTVCPL